MSWQKLTLQAPNSLIEQLSELLTDIGAVAVTLEAAHEEELFEPAPGTTPLWPHTQIIALFEAEADLQQVLNFIELGSHPKILPHYTIQSLADQNWQKICTDAFQPICFGNKLWVYPSWHAPPDNSMPHVLLDPGLAFGTGSHPTTALCLKWLAQNVQQGEQLIDYGCGSGILAIAALKLGAHHAWAVDNDPQAREATLENSQRNSLPPSTIAVVAPEDLPNLCVDVLIANILANPIIKLSKHFADLVKPEGNLVLSGLLTSQTHSVVTQYAPWFEFTAPLVQEEWVLLHAKRKGAS